MRNSLNDLNNALFEQLERLMDNDTDLDVELKRSKAVTDVAKNIIENAQTMLDAQKHVDEYYGDRSVLNTAKLIGGTTNE